MRWRGLLHAPMATTNWHPAINLKRRWAVTGPNAPRDQGSSETLSNAG